ncbi:MAG: hypothetical protein LUH05_02365 [Candidatus Gastranaerophilales bacterium]|nr:hypothetical protein [Candidatus Gastranaerophilales bacterium]
MNISAVSFGNKEDYDIDIPSWVNDNHRPQSTLERTPQKDQFQKQPVKKTSHNSSVKKQGNNHKNTKGKRKIKGSVRGFAAGVLSVLMVNAGIAGVSQIGNTNTVTIPYDDSSSIYEIADTYDVDAEAILSYNGITEDTDLEELTEISIPSSYDYIQDEIDSLQEKLYNTKTSDEEREEISEQINALKEKREYQQNIATVYTDGKYVYFEIKEIDENSPEEIYENFKYGINVEIFKDIFDIEDGAVRKYNNLSRVYVSGDPEVEEDKGYYSYSNNRFSAGDVIKVPVKSIMTDDISLNY